MMKKIQRMVAAALTMIAAVLVLSAVNERTVRAGQNKNATNASTSGTVSAGDGNAEKGRQLYINSGCYECHGYEGQGGSYTGPRIAPDPLPWQVIAAFIRNPPNLNSPATKDSAMPPYPSKLLSDRDVQDIGAYLKSIISATDIKNIPSYRN